MNDAKISLIDCLINKNDVNQLLDHVKEICKFDVWNITLEIYFDYYAIMYPKYERFIYSKLNEWNELHNKTKLYVIYKLLFQSKHNKIVHSIRTFSGKIKKKPYLSFIKQFNDDYKNLFLAVLKYNNYIYYYLELLLKIKTAKEIYIELLLYFYKRYKPEDTFENIKENCMPKWDDKLYKNDAHYLLAVIMHVTSDIVPSNAEVKLVTRKSNISSSEEIKNEIISDSNGL